MILLTFAYFFPLAGNSTKAYYWLLKESRNKLFRDLEKLRLKVEELFRDSGIINNNRSIVKNLLLLTGTHHGESIKLRR